MRNILSKDMPILRRITAFCVQICKEDGAFEMCLHNMNERRFVHKSTVDVLRFISCCFLLMWCSIGNKYSYCESQLNILICCLCKRKGKLTYRTKMQQYHDENGLLRRRKENLYYFLNIE